MVFIDFKDVYYCIFVFKNYQKYLKFYWNLKLYKYRVCFMGLCMSFRLYIKVFKLVFVGFRKFGYQFVIYIDDIYL